MAIPDETFPAGTGVDSELLRDREFSRSEIVETRRVVRRVGREWSGCWEDSLPLSKVGAACWAVGCGTVEGARSSTSLTRRRTSVGTDDERGSPWHPETLLRPYLDADHI